MVELMAVLALITLMVSAVLPGVITFTHRSALRNEAAALLLFLEKAYSYSLSTQERVRVVASEHHLIAQNETGQTITQYELRNGVSLGNTNQDNQTITLYPSISVSPQTLKLLKGSQSCEVVASLRGRFRATC